MTDVRVGNAIVMRLLRSPLHPLLSRGVDVIRYRGRRSGRTFSTPTQYVQCGDAVVILVGRPRDKTWWRNFRTEHPVDVLLRGEWHAMTGRAIVGADEPAKIRPLLDAYLTRFPKAARALEGGDADARARGAVVVQCLPR